ncbi:unnamed protein product [Malus baccata var. baccata]
MMREKIKIRKIDCLPARQKARELSILCESEAAVIIFSQTGKLFDFSSSSTKDVIARYKNKSHTSGEKSDQPTFDQLQVIQLNIVIALTSIEDKTRKLRQMKGEERQDLGLNELQKLEK